MLAWVLTLPVCVMLEAATFSAGLYVVFKHLVPEVTSICLAAALLLMARRLWIWVARQRNEAVAVAA